MATNAGGLDTRKSGEAFRVAVTTSDLNVVPMIHCDVFVNWIQWTEDIASESIIGLA